MCFQGHMADGTRTAGTAPAHSVGVKLARSGAQGSMQRAPVPCTLHHSRQP